MSSDKYYINNTPINIYNLYKYMINLYKLGVIPEFKVHFNNDLSEIIFVTEYNNPKWEKEGTSIIIYNNNIKKWKSCINTHTKDELCLKYPHLLEKNLFTDITVINEEYLTFESYYIDDILEPSLNPFDPCYLDSSCYYDLRKLYSINNQKIDNMYFSSYHGFINNSIHKEFNIENNNCSYLTYNDFINKYLF